MLDKAKLDLLAKVMQRVVQERLTPNAPAKEPPQPAK